jgi:1-acyl-sn-glycerol-3-phosphate acyltransferase
MLPFKKGGFHLAVDAGVPIVPIAVNHSRSLLPKGSWVPATGEIEVVVGRPIPTDGLSKDELPELIDRTRATIVAARRRDPCFKPDAAADIDGIPDAVAHRSSS